MKLILHSLIVWLVLLAVPFQGLATAAALPSAGCVHTQARAGHHAPQQAAPAHHGASQQAVAQDSCADHHSRCSNCADSCMSVSIAPASVPAVVVHAPAAVSIPFDLGHVPSVDLDHPERPPRFARA